jgi:small subunit ribosomal protein S10
MAYKARIKLNSTNIAKVQEVCEQIKEVASRTGSNLSGPIALPTKRLKVPVRKSSCGAGSETWNHWELRIHKRLIELEADDRALRRLMHIQIPDDVDIEIVLKS